MRVAVVVPAALCLIGTAQANDAQISAVKIIVLIAVDGLRGDILNRYNPNLGEVGFRRLMEGGVWYTNVHHAQANTETIVGHTTLATCAHPSEHGMIVNS